MELQCTLVLLPLLLLLLAMLLARRMMPVRKTAQLQSEPQQLVDALFRLCAPRGCTAVDARHATRRSPSIITRPQARPAMRQTRRTHKKTSKSHKLPSSWSYVSRLHKCTRPPLDPYCSTNTTRALHPATKLYTRHRTQGKARLLRRDARPPLHTTKPPQLTVSQSVTEYRAPGTRTRRAQAQPRVPLSADLHGIADRAHSPPRTSSPQRQTRRWTSPQTPTPHL